MSRTATAKTAGKSLRTAKTQKTTKVKKTATKKAVQKTVSKKATLTIKKVGTAKTAKNPTKKPAKKITAKKTTVKKKAARKAVAIKRTSKKPEALRPKTDKTFHALFKLTPPEELDTYPADTVSVPQGPNERVRSRVAALRAVLETIPIDRTMRRIAYVGGRISILAGAAVTSFSLASASLVPLAAQPALVTDTTSSETANAITQITAATLAATFDVEDILKDEHEIGITTNGGDLKSAYLVNTETGAYHELDLREDVPEQFWWLFRARVADVPAGYYVVLAKVQLGTELVELKSHRVVVDPIITNSGTSSVDDSTATTATTNPADDAIDDIVLEPVVDIADIPDVIDGIRTVQVRAAYVTSVNATLRDANRTRAVRLVETQYDDFEETYLFKLDSTTVPDGKYDVVVRVTSESGAVLSYESNTFKIENVSYEDVLDEEKTTTDETLDDEEDLETTFSNALEPSAADALPELLIKLDTIRSTERYKVIAMNAPGASFMEVYARSLVATQPQFLGLAQRLDSEGRFVYSLDATTLPSGVYLITGRTKISGDLFTTPRLELMVYTSPKVTIATEPILENIQTTEIEKVATIVKEQQIVTPTITEIAQEEIELVPREDDAAIDSEPVDLVAFEAKALFDEYKERIESALQRYTSALRSEDEAAINRTRAALDKLTSEMVLALYQSERAHDYVDDTETRIKALIERLATQTEATETIIKTRTNDAISIDSDGDGITDYDEIEIYKTDPNNADSDQDGFVDGAEVLSGFNPNDPAYEAVITYESPKESGVVRDDVLEVAEIVPVVKPVVPVGAEDQVADEPQKVEIRGKALPNSFVTLYIYSTPIIVTVKTADDGSWSYTLDKELEDGEHEIYVGMTDNTGAVIAKSNPFRFVKEAQAFSPVDAVSAATVTVTPDEPLAPATSTATILGLTLLVIGLLLILIGYYLERMRPEEDGVVAVPA